MAMRSLIKSIFNLCEYERQLKRQTQNISRKTWETVLKQKRKCLILIKNLSIRPESFMCTLSFELCFRNPLRYPNTQKSAIFQMFHSLFAK